jgi:hypothetical protein
VLVIDSVALQICLFLLMDVLYLHQMLRERGNLSRAYAVRPCLACKPNCEPYTDCWFPTSSNFPLLLQNLIRNQKS